MLKNAHLPLRIQILVSKEDNAALRHQCRKFIELLTTKLADLDSLQNRADTLGEIDPLDTRSEQSTFLWVCERGAVRGRRYLVSDRFRRNMREDLGVEEGVQSYRESGVWGDVLAGLEVGHFCTVSRV